MTDFERLLQALVGGDVEFIIIGGMAATAHGSAHEALLPRSEARTIFGLQVRLVDLETLIRLKRAAGRPKDLERIAELEAIIEERKKA